MGGYFHCIELVRTIYGLQKALIMCNEAFDGFVCLIRVLLLVYVNDVLVTSN